jgi:Ser/Thr protein kinase RdoA (MazF antagonist)
MTDFVRVYREKLNLPDAHFEKIEHEQALVAIVYKVTLPDGTAYILKISPKEIHYQRELWGLQIFANILPVAKVIQTVPPSLGVYGAILMEILPGSLVTEQNLTQDVAVQLGAMLAKIHQVRTSGYGEIVQPETWILDPVQYVESNLIKRSAGCRPLVSQKLLDQVENYFEHHKELLKSVDGPCAVHWDFRAGNILIDHDRVGGILDWAGARSSFAQDDFVRFFHNGWPSPCSVNPAENSAMPCAYAQAFLQGYASIRPVPKFGEMMPLLRMSTTLNTMDYLIKVGTAQGKDAWLFDYNHNFLKEFFKNTQTDV